MATITLANRTHRPIIRYAVGAMLLVAVGMGFGWPLAQVLPVLSLSFLAPGGKPPALKGGLFFVLSIVVACAVGLTLAYCFLPMPPIHILITFLLLFHIFYAQGPIFNPLVKVWLLIAVLLIPNIALQSGVLTMVVAYSLVWNAACAILVVWVIYLIFPLAPENHMTAAPAPKAAEVPSNQQRFITALTSTLVIMPVYLAFYFANMANALLILVFTAILSMQPGFAKDWKKGKALIIGNTIGGLAAILAFEILTIVPIYGFLLLLILLAGLVFGQFVFGQSPAAPLYGMAFSTFLLIVCSVTASDSEGAGGAVWSRVLQIMVAVIYVVLAFGLAAKLGERK
jgi:hypothetical protein